MKKKLINTLVKNRTKHYFNKITKFVKEPRTKAASALVVLTVFPSKIAPDEVVEYIEQRKEAEKATEEYKHALTLYSQSLERLPDNVSVIRLTD